MVRPRIVLVAMLLSSGCPGGSGATTGTATDASTTEPASSTTDSATLVTASTSTTAPDTSSSGDPDTSTGTSTGSVPECPRPPVDGMPDVALEVVADGFSEGVLAVGDPIEDDVVYVLQKSGEVKRIDPGVVVAPAEDWIAFDVTESYEAGLLSMAFHPEFATDPRLFVAFTPGDGGYDQYVSEFAVVDGVVDESSRRDLLATPAPVNHYGGMIHFGLDGMLYVSVGDGGPQDDPCGNGQYTDTFWGKLLRLDPNPDGTPDAFPGCTGGCDCPVPAGDFDYTIPPDNPFVGDDGVRDEIFAIGFRNPWRFAIDPVDGRIWVGDVGQDGWEEVDIAAAGANFGWSDMEGFHCNHLAGCDESAGPGEVNGSGYTMPIVEYSLGPACSVIALGTYRSCEVPAWHGRFFYADNCTGEVFAVAFDGTEVDDVGLVGSVAPETINGGGYNARGDVFVVTAGPLSTGPGPLYRIAPAR